MKKLYIIMVSALAWAGIVLAGCSEIEPAEVSFEKGQQYTLCVKATKSDIATKGFSYEESQNRKTKNLESLWVVGDKLSVYDNDIQNGEAIVVLEAKSIADGGLSADFEAVLDNEQQQALGAATTLRLEYKAPDYEISNLNLKPTNLGSGEGDGTPLQYSCIENPMDGGAW